MDEEFEAPQLPSQFGLKSLQNNKYLTFVRKEKELIGYLQFTGERIISPYTKFEIESSKIGKDLVHIRCCYNNTYWVLHSQTSNYIVAAAKAPNEDQSKPTCTLFKPTYDDSHKGYKFKNAYLDRYINLDNNSDNPDHLATFIDWDSLCILPRYVAFKGNNNHYLRPYHHPTGNIYLQFRSSDISDPGIKHEIIGEPDGQIRIKNVPYGRNWTYDPTWIVIKGKDSSSENKAGELFWPIKVENNVIALRCVANNRICKRLTSDNKHNCLNAYESSIVDEGRMEVKELVDSREIYDINFRLTDARVYNERPLVMASGINQNSKDVADKVSVKLSYEDTTTSTWNSCVTMKFGVKTTIDTGVPKVSEGEVEISGEISGAYTWGETEQTKSIVEVVHDVVVGAWSRVKTSIIAVQASCDVPFSYTQKDRLMNGRTVITRLDDGIFTGVNCYNFQFLAEEV